MARNFFGFFQTPGWIYKRIRAIICYKKGIRKDGPIPRQRAGKEAKFFLANLSYRKIEADELTLSLFRSFIRRQKVTKCRRRIDGRWTVPDAPFIDVWNQNDYRTLLDELQQILKNGGQVFGAFCENELKGFAAVDGTPFGSRNQYCDLIHLYVSEELRRQGIGKVLFHEAKRFASQKAEKLYISAHSAIESQAFYRAMGCVEASEYDPKHIEKEPFDCQLECPLTPAEDKDELDTAALSGKLPF